MFCTVFDGSGFTRTVCGGHWSLNFKSATGSNGRLGCCNAGSFMSKPNLNPFSTATACQSCSSGRTTSVENAFVECAVSSTGSASISPSTAANYSRNVWIVVGIAVGCGVLAFCCTKKKDRSETVSNMHIPLVDVEDGELKTEPEIEDDLLSSDDLQVEEGQI